MPANLGPGLATMLKAISNPTRDSRQSALQGLHAKDWPQRTEQSLAALITPNSAVVIARLPYRLI